MATPPSSDDREEPVVPSMSLSRRYLSLPQELAGCSLPPKLAGRRYGAVTLCIAHILESAVSERPLPRVSLVRVRWWGEDQPGSLFRPSVLSSDGGHSAAAGEAEEPPPRQRAIAMRYPVCVPPEHLLEYFHDMKELWMDVIDRATRRKFGRCCLSLAVENDSSGAATAEQKIAALRRDNALCEIRASGPGEDATDFDDGEVLGYLAVSFKVQWTSPEVPGYQEQRRVTCQVKQSVQSPSGGAEEADSAVRRPQFLLNQWQLMPPSPSDFEAKTTAIESEKVITVSPIAVEDQGWGQDADEFAVSSSESALSSPHPDKKAWIDLFHANTTGGGATRFPSLFAVGSRAMAVNREPQPLRKSPKKRRRVPEVRESNSDFQRVRQLLEKGKALQRLMERAMKDSESDGDRQSLEVTVAHETPATTDLNEEESAMKQVRQALMLTPYEELTSTATAATTWEEMLNNVLQADQLTSPAFPKHSPTADEKTRSVSRGKTELTARLLGGADRLELVFESMELEHDFVDTQLRQLRDSSSVSSRFSPIQIRVSHADVASLVWPQQGFSEEDASHGEITAFSVTTSLRKRQWRLDCSHTVSLLEPTRLCESTGNGIPTKTRSGDVKPLTKLQFFVRCENRNDVQRNEKRREHQQLPYPSKCLLLSGGVDATTIFSHAARVEEAWTATVPLVFENAENDDTTRQEGRRTRPKRKMKARCVGYLQVKFVFHASEKEDDSAKKADGSIKSDRGSELSLPSYSSNPDDNLILLDQGRQASMNPSPFQKFLQPEAHLSDLGGDRGLLEFAVMLKRATNVRVSAPILSGVESSEPSTIALRYVVPSQFSKHPSKQLPTAEVFERTIRRRLTPSRWLGSSSTRWADFNDHINIFPSSFPEDADKFFSTAYLIVEVWHHAKDADGRLLGLVKIPLCNFSSFFRDTRVEMRDFCKETLPFTGVDGVFPIEDPFSGSFSGSLRARLCVGTAEQILVLTSTIRAVIKLQSTVRGFVCRKRLGYHQFHRISATDEPSRLTMRSRDEAGDNRSESHSTAPTASTRAWGGERSIDLREFNDGGGSLKKRSGVYIDELEDAGSGSWLHKIRFDIRKCWQMVQKSTPRGNMTREKSRHDGNNVAPLLGCELQGQLVLVNDSAEWPSEGAKGIPFALWWDAVDSNLNSFFEHSFQGRGCSSFVNSNGAANLPFVGPRSQLLFAFRVENGFFSAQSRETVMGEARLDLYQALVKSKTSDNHGESGIVGVDDKGVRCVDVDVPIQWDGWGQEGRRNSKDTTLASERLPCVFPLKISYRVSSNLALQRPLDRRFTPESEFSDELFVDEGHRERSIAASTMKRLVPASITLSLNLLTLTDFKHALHEKRRQVLNHGADLESLTCYYLDELVRNDRDSQAVMIFDVKICLGTELHGHEEAEDQWQQQKKDSNDAKSWLVTENGRWFKRWRSSRVSLRVYNGSSKSPSEQHLPQQLAMQTQLILHPEVMASLQDECAEVTTALWCEACREAHTVGTTAVPLAAILFRPDGVQGLFPIRIGEVLAGRIGVHCFLDHRLSETAQTDVRTSTVDRGTAHLEDLQLVPDQLVSPHSPPILLSPTSPEEISSLQTAPKPPLYSLEVCIQEARNIPITDAEEGGTIVETDPKTFATFSLVNGETGESIGGLCDETDKKTATSGACPRWNHCGVIAANILHWQDLNLEVSVWQLDRKHDGSPGWRASRSLIGKARVDLSLLVGWREIDGWYHLLDGQQMNQGQVKVRVKRLGAEGDADMKATSHSAGSATEEESLGQHEFETRGFEKDEIRRLSFDSAVKVVHQASQEIHTRLEGLSAAEEEGIAVEMGENESPIADHPTKLEVDDESSMFESIVAGVPHLETAPEGDRITRADLSGTLETEHSTPSSEAIGLALDMDDRFQELDSVASDDTPLAINVEPYKPITLASFGIEEMELSPFTDGSASPRQHESEREQGGEQEAVEAAVGSPRSSHDDFNVAEEHEDASSCEEGGEEVELYSQTHQQETEVEARNGHSDNHVEEQDGEMSASTHDAELELAVVTEFPGSSSSVESCKSYDGSVFASGEASVAGLGSDDITAEIQAGHDHAEDATDVSEAEISEMVDANDNDSVDRDDALMINAREVSLGGNESNASEVRAESPGKSSGAESNPQTEFQAQNWDGNDDTSSIQQQLDEDDQVALDGSDAAVYVDKAVQVNLVDLGFRDELEAFRSAEGSDVTSALEFGRSSRSDEVEDDGEEVDDFVRSTVDAACDAMGPEELQSPTEGAGHLVSQSTDDEAVEQLNDAQEEAASEFHTNVKVPTPLDNAAAETSMNQHDRSTAQLVRSTTAATNTDHDSALDTAQRPVRLEPTNVSGSSGASSLQSGKLELVIELLREICTSCVADAITSRSSLEKPTAISDSVLVPEEKPSCDEIKMSASEQLGTVEERCNCPSPQVALPPPPTSTIVLPSFNEKAPEVQLIANARGEASKLQLEIEQSMLNTAVRSAAHIPAQSLSASTFGGLADTSAATLVATRNATCVSVLPNNFSPSGMSLRTTKSDWQHSRQAMEKKLHPPARSLFASDSETERIARIMQGSMDYWLNDSTGCEDEASDDGDDCYF